ncbi:uncharacterized protein [Lepeophtheirus salmonis]|uniref:uncharacterized protein n=1 Tax=Lepeophtheirus salmonis TaxID=72036 RepID=UPI001AE5E578|nr:uncharacterized protein LOC121129930 [Lepeophtheirus salmonis]
MWDDSSENDLLLRVQDPILGSTSRDNSHSEELVDLQNAASCQHSLEESPFKAIQEKEWDLDELLENESIKGFSLENDKDTINTSVNIPFNAPLHLLKKSWVESNKTRARIPLKSIDINKENIHFHGSKTLLRKPKVQYLINDTSSGLRLPRRKTLNILKKQRLKEGTTEDQSSSLSTLAFLDSRKTEMVEKRSRAFCWKARTSHEL